MDQSHRLSLTMEFRPSIEGIDATRRFLSDMALEHLCDGEWTSRVALVAQELLENVVKYSVDGAAALAVDVVPAEDANVISVRVRSRGRAGHVTVLQQLVGEIAEAVDPMAYYVETMRKSAGRDEGSGLGLARIRAEAEMSLSADVDGDSVCVLAQARVTDLGAPYRRAS
jgi:hypothetical protein